MQGKLVLYIVKKGKVKKASKKSGKSENSENLAVSLTDLSSYP